MTRFKPFITPAILALVFLLWPLGFEQGEAHSSLWTGFIASLHPLILHLPIGLVVGILAIELWRPKETASKAGILPLFWLLTALTASLSFGTGYFLGEEGGYDEELLTEHLWWAGGFTALAWIGWGIARNGGKRSLRLTALGLSLLAVLVAGHHGGVMVHGDPLASAPWKKRAGPPRVLPPVGDPIDVYAHLIQPLMEAKCQACHGPEKVKGKLRVDTYERLMKGGTDLALEPGDSEFSLMIEMIEYPLDDEEHMPPEDEPQITPEELALLKWWIDEGAEESLLIDQADAPEVVRPFLVPNYRLLPDPELEARQKAEAAAQAVAEHELRAERIKRVLALPDALRRSFSFSSQDTSELHFRPSGSPSDFGDEELAQVIPAIVSCSRVDLGSSSVSAAAVARIPFDATLRQLSLKDTAIDASALAALANASSLESLNLFGTNLGDAEIAQLPALPELKKLYLGHTRISASGLESLQTKYPMGEIIGNLGFDSP